MTPDDSTTARQRAAYEAERSYWVRHADDHYQEADLPFIRWHQQQVLRHFAVPPTATIAEVGCGAGKLFRDHPGPVLLIDFSPAILAQARRQSPRVMAVCASVDRLPFKTGSLGHLAANNMLHHVKGEGLLDAAVDEFARVLASDGRLYVNDRNPTWLHHLIILVTMTLKKGLAAIYGEFGGCGSFNEPLFTRRDWARIERRFRFLGSARYYTAGMWLVDSIAKGLAVVGRRDRGFVGRCQQRALTLLLRLERHAPAALCIERTTVATPVAGRD